MALPNTNITTTLVGTTLGSSSRDVGTLCTHPNINKWSKWKPVRFNKVEGLTLADLTGVDFGLIPPPNNTDYLNVIGFKWVYARPRGGANEPYRLGDFRNYNNIAPPVIILPDNLTINRTSSTHYYYDVGISRGSATTLGIEDFEGIIGDLYMGVVIVRGGLTYLITSDRTIGEGDGRITFNTQLPPFNTNGTGVLYNVLTTARVPSITLLNNVSPAPFFKSMPIGDNDNDTFNFMIIGGIGINIQMTGIGSSVNSISPSLPYTPRRASIWQTGKEYFVGDHVQLVFGGTMYVCAQAHTSTIFQSDLDAGRWNLALGNQYFQTGGSMYFRLSLNNTSEDVQSFFVHNLTMSTTQTFFGMSYTSPISAYDNNTFQQLGSSIVLSPGAQAQVIVGVNDFMNRNNGSISTPVAGTEVTPVFRVMYNAEVIATGEFNIRAL